jgi:hypothetical protein
MFVRFRTKRHLFFSVVLTLKDFSGSRVEEKGRAMFSFENIFRRKEERSFDIVPYFNLNFENENLYSMNS